jgi:cytochrome P450
MLTTVLYGLVLGVGYVVWRLWQRQRDGPIVPSSIPGPPQIPFFGNMFQLDPKRGVTQFETWAFQHGPIYKVRLLGKEGVYISDPDEVLGILKKRPDTFRRVKGVANLFEDLKVHGLFSMEGADWKESRNVIASALSNARVAQMKTCIVEHAHKLNSELHIMADKQAEQMSTWFSNKESERSASNSQFTFEALLDVQPLIQDCILAIVGETTMSYGNEPVFDKSMFADINHMFVNINHRIFSPIRSILGFQNSDDRRAQRTAARIGMIAKKVIEKWKQEKGAQLSKSKDDDEEDKLKKTLLHGILETEGTLSEEKIVGNIAQVIVAGYGKWTFGSPVPFRK